MSIERFGKYLIEIDSPKIGMEIPLDGYDGFLDQSLDACKKGDKLRFFINPSTSKELLNHDFLVTEVLEDSNNYGGALVRIIEISNLNDFF